VRGLWRVFAKWREHRLTSIATRLTNRADALLDRAAWWRRQAGRDDSEKGS
jgi:hypothetical protein